ncbi:MAG: hypothetical protein OXU66_08005 [Gammaproteobacteria bacterium]|nr:hypothetical protein [Gammaproteobacteria bacterium]MDD9895248.1 hypothetical protein [Gammaproteobacteria bacterium]MDD9958870.1 hypothetical protein [Gammaproteobacteria bacterium]
MTTKAGSGINSKWIGLVVVLFGILLLAQHGNELLKQLVITPGSVAAQGVAADCRADELEEEGLSLRECELLVSNVQITLVSSPDWFRPAMMLFSLLGSLFAVSSIYLGISVAANSNTNSLSLKTCLGVLLLIDLLVFVAASNTGPLLRAQYLWPSLLWFFVHATLLAAALAHLNEQSGSEA